MAKLHPLPADDESDFTFFQVFPEDKVINVSIACELIDRIAGEKLGEPRRLQFLSDQSDLFSTAAVRRLSAHGFCETITLDESDFPELQLNREKRHD